MKQLPALALFERALRLETRSALFCWARAGLLGIILLVLFPIQTMARYGWYGAPGLRFLGQMVWVNLIFISLAGLSYFASAITEEKEEMTLGLLRMTDLNPIAILLGKSTSRMIGALLLLLVQVPFILLAVTLGGVGLPQVVAAYGTLLAYMFLLSNLALFFSVVFRNTTTAGAVSLFLMIVFFFGHYWALGIEQSIGTYYNVNLNQGVWPAITSFIQIWQLATPSERIGVIFQTGFAGPIFNFQVWSNLVLGVLFFLAAWLVFDRCTREEKDSSPARQWMFFRRTNRRSRIPPSALGPGAITWKDFTFIGGGKVGLLLKFTVAGALIGLINFIALQSDGKVSLEFEGGTLIWISIAATMVWLALDASRIFKEEVRWKTLSSLMTLPMSPSHIAYRKALGALLGTLPLLSLLVIGIVLVPKGFSDFLDTIFREPSAFGMLLVAFLQFILFLHLTAFLSLVIKRGALPLAIAIQYLGGSFFLGLISSVFMMAGGVGALSFVLCFICLVLIVVLHRAIGYRLERVAAEE